VSATRCRAIRDDGKACRGAVTQPGGYCLWHDPNTSPQVKQAVRALGGRRRKLRMAPTLPAGAPDPRYATREEIVRWCEAMAGKVGRGELDPKLSAELRQWGALALAVRQQESLEALARSLSVLEHGAGAVLLLERLRDGLADGRRRPLPGRAPALPAADGEGA